MGNIDLLEDACAKLPHTSRKMFGGHGLFAQNGGMFAGIVDDDRIVLKFARGEPAGDEFRKAGGVPRVYKGKQGAMSMEEWLLVPDEMYDEPQALAAWAAKAHRVAPAKKTPATKKAPAAKSVATKAPPRHAAPKKAAPKKSATKPPAKRKK